MVGDADALADGGEESVLEQLAQIGLAGEHEGDVGTGVEFIVHHALDGGESGGIEVLGVVDDDDGFAVQFGNGLEEQLAGLAGEKGGSILRPSRTALTRAAAERPEPRM